MILTFKTEIPKEKNDYLSICVENAQIAYTDYINGNPDAFEKLTKILNLKQKAENLAFKNFNCMYEYEDFYNELVVCLLYCIKKYDQTKGVCFYAYYCRSSKNHIINMLKQNKIKVNKYKNNIPIKIFNGFIKDGREDAFSLWNYEKCQINQNDFFSDPIYLLEKKELSEKINDAILNLKESDQNVFLRLIGYNPYVSPCSILSVMESTNLSKKQVLRSFCVSKRMLQNLLKDYK